MLPPTSPPSAFSIVEVTVSDWTVPLLTPFGIATGAQLVAENLLVEVHLASGARGLGEAAPFPAVSGETRDQTRAALLRLKESLVGVDARHLRPLAGFLYGEIAEARAARCALETAVLDALARHHQMPLWSYFGGAQTSLCTDMTIPTGTVEEAGAAARKIQQDGFEVIKLKVGGHGSGSSKTREDRERIEAVLREAPMLSLILDGNCGIETVEEALGLVEVAQRAGGQVVLFEEPFAVGDYRAMREFSRRSPVPLAADESAVFARDVLTLAREEAARVINIKIMKSGIVEALDMVACARALGLSLMVGGMVETELAMTTSACLAAGQGGFSFVDLDTPFFMAESNLRGQELREGPLINLSGISAGHGVDRKLGGE